MADENINKPRPNIRIEIQNNICDSMEVDEAEEDPKLSDGEEGEILEEAADFDSFLGSSITYPKRPTPESIEKSAWVSVATKGFVTGINIFDADEELKQKERAERFALEPREVSSFNDADLRALHDSLGISSDNGKNMRLEAIHMHGTDEMSSKDVLDYFVKYSPNAIEWISDECCNVTWSDVITPARALLHLSKVVAGMPVVGSRDPFEKESIRSTRGKSILLKTSSRDVEFEEDNAGEAEPESISTSDISVPIPPGYWRLGVPHPKSKCILLRYALKTDKKPFKAEKFSEYYRKYGNPNYGGLKGIISESKKAEFKGILERNKEINSIGKNPWGYLAWSWNNDRKTEEIVVPVEEESTSLDTSLKQRLGFKRKQQLPETVETSEKSKIPRMRMYADEEEEKVKRKLSRQATQRLGNGTSKQGNDLRAMIGRKNGLKHSKTVVDKLADEEKNEESSRLEIRPSRNDDTETSIDLGSKLMNRKLKFSSHLNINPKSKEKSDVKARISTSAQVVSKQHRFRADSMRKKRYKSPPPPSRPSRSREKFSNFDKSHSDFDSDEEADDSFGNYGRTNSKVTVVIKKHKQPAVASTVWSRVNSRPSRADRSKVETMKHRLHVSHLNSRSSDESSDSEFSLSEESIQDEDKIEPSFINRPGFRNSLAANFKIGEHKSPLRIEINNDHFVD